MMFTYSPEYNSGCFPMLDNCEGIEQQLRQSVADETSYQHVEPWRYPKQRPVEDYKKPIYDVTDTRKWELKNENAPWVENAWSGHLKVHEGIVRGAFDCSSTGSRPHNDIIKVRRACLEPLPEQIVEAKKKEKVKEDAEAEKAAKRMKQPEVKFAAQFKPARPNLVDKYFTQIRDGDAVHQSLRFDKRRADQWLQRMEDANMLPQGTTAKYGKGPKVGIVETLPSSYQHHEKYHEEPMNSEHPSQLARDCSKPVAPYGPGVLSTDKSKMHINSKRTPLTLEETNGRLFQRPLNRVSSLPALPR